MGTYGDYRGEGTSFERSVSEKMQDLFLTFARNPQYGLQEIGWPTVSGTIEDVSGDAIVFARDGKVVEMEGVRVLDSQCPVSGAEARRVRQNRHVADEL